jgi:thiol-disulfide isomerase/thioredoxin
MFPFIMNILLTVFLVAFLIGIVTFAIYYFKKDKGGNKTAEILFFYTDWCPHCTSAKPEWNSFKEETKTNGYNITFNEINCTKETPKSEAMMEKYKVEGFPTIKLLANGKVYDFDAKPTKETLSKFLNTVL